jgi:pyruvate kinase
MIARGDLGVELDYVQVPKAQRDVFEYCRSIGMPVVCATEMLGSMATASRPTRAEVSDVEGTMRLGYDAIVLTAETAMGQDPVKVVEVAGRIRSATELDSKERNAGQRSDDGAIAEAAVAVGEEIEVEAIVVLTSTGRTARLVAAERPRLASYAVAGERGIARRISLYYGILAVLAEREGGVEASAGAILRTLVANGSITAGAKCVLVGSRVGPDQDADLIMIRRAV